MTKLEKLTAYVLTLAGTSKTLNIPGSAPDFELAITVDNGGSSAADQTWTGDHFVSATLTSGSYTMSWDAATVFEKIFSFTTDSSGALTGTYLNSIWGFGNDNFGAGTQGNGGFSSVSQDWHYRDTQDRENQHTDATKASVGNISDFSAWSGPTPAPSRSVVTEYTTGGGPSGPGYFGQTFTTPAGGPWDNLTFHWYQNPTTPIASGALYLLDRNYTGTPNALSPATPGFLAKSTSIIGNKYIFPAPFTLNPNTQYFAYMDGSAATPVGVSFVSADVYSGGEHEGLLGDSSHNYKPGGGGPGDLLFTVQAAVQAAAQDPAPFPFDPIGKDGTTFKISPANNPDLGVYLDSNNRLLLVPLDDAPGWKIHHVSDNFYRIITDETAVNPANGASLADHDWVVHGGGTAYGTQLGLDNLGYREGSYPQYEFAFEADGNGFRVMPRHAYDNDPRLYVQLTDWGNPAVVGNKLSLNNLAGSSEGVLLQRWIVTPTP